MLGEQNARVEVYESNAGTLDLYWLVDGKATWWADYCGREGEAADTFIALAGGANPVEDGWEGSDAASAEGAYVFDAENARLIVTAEGDVCSVDDEALCSSGKTFAWRLVSDEAKYVIEDYTTGDFYVCDGKDDLRERLMGKFPHDEEDCMEAIEALARLLPSRLGSWREYLGGYEDVLNINVKLAVEARRGRSDGERLDPAAIRHERLAR